MPMTREKLYLLAAGFGLGGIGLTYGVAPSDVLPKLMEVSVEGIDQTHVYRGVMGVYVGMGVYWILSAFRPGWSRAAILSVVFLMAGVAIGRVLSVVADGTPSPMLVVYLGAEIGLALIGILLLKESPSAPPP